MKKVSLVLSLLLSCNLVFAGPIKTVEEGGKKPTTPGKEPAVVKVYRERLSSALGTSYKAEGLSSLAQARPELTNVINNSGKKLGEGSIQDAIKADPKFFEAAALKADVAATTAALARGDQTMTARLVDVKTEQSTAAGKLVQAMEAGSISLIAELAQAGPKANKEKGAAVLEALSSVSINNLKSDADVIAKTAEIESKLSIGLDKKITLEDFIKKCLELAGK